MQGLLNFTQQYLPELEKVTAASKSKSFLFKGKEFRLRTRKNLRKPRKFSPANKIARTVFKSMQAHVDRLTKNSSRYMELSKIAQKGYQTFPREILKKTNEKSTRPKKCTKPKLTIDMTGSKTSGKKDKTSKNSKLTGNSSSSTNTSKSNKCIIKRKKIAKPKIKKRKVSKEATIKKPENDVKNLFGMKLDEFLSCLKSLQNDLTALKIPDFSTGDAVTRERKKSPKKATAKKLKNRLKKNSDWSLNREMSSHSMFSGDDYDFKKYFTGAQDFTGVRSHPEGGRNILSSIQRFAELYGKSNNSNNLANVFACTAVPGLNINIGDDGMKTSDFFEWAQRPLKGIKFPDGVA